MAPHRPAGASLALLRRSLCLGYTRAEAAGAPRVCADAPPLSNTSTARGSHSPARGSVPGFLPGFGAEGNSLLGGGECTAGEWGSSSLGTGRVFGAARLHSGSRMVARSIGIPCRWGEPNSTSPSSTPYASPYTPAYTCTSTSRTSMTSMSIITSTGASMRSMGSAASAATLESIREQIKGPAEIRPLAMSFDGKQRRDNRQDVGYQVVHRGAPTGNLNREGSAGEEREGAEEEAEGGAGPGVSVGLKPVQAVRKAVFAVVQVGSHQFKVSPGDVIYTEKLLFADLNDTVHLDRVLLLGSRHETVIGRPSIPGAHVVALVEEQVQDAKVIVFKKKRRKNYRRHRGHRQELTRLFIVDIHGIEETPGGESGAGATTAEAEGSKAAVGA